MTNLLAQHEAGIGADALDVFVELEQAVLVAPDDLLALQHLDEIMEQRLVEEVRRVQAVDHRKPLGTLLAELLETSARQAP